MISIPYRSYSNEHSPDACDMPHLFQSLIGLILTRKKADRNAHIRKFQSLIGLILTGRS